MPYLYRTFSAKDPLNWWVFCGNWAATCDILWVFATLYTSAKCFLRILTPDSSELSISFFETSCACKFPKVVPQSATQGRWDMAREKKGKRPASSQARSLGRSLSKLNRNFSTNIKFVNGYNLLAHRHWRGDVVSIHRLNSCVNIAHKSDNCEICEWIQYTRTQTLTRRCCIHSQIWCLCWNVCSSLRVSHRHGRVNSLILTAGLTK